MISFEEQYFKILLNLIYHFFLLWFLFFYPDIANAIFIFSKSFMVLGFMFRLVIHIELTFYVWSKRRDKDFFFFSYDYPVFLAIDKLFSLNRWVCLLLKSVLYFCMHLFYTNTIWSCVYSILTSFEIR